MALAMVFKINWWQEIQIHGRTRSLTILPQNTMEKVRLLRNKRRIISFFGKVRGFGVAESASYRSFFPGASHLVGYHHWGATLYPDPSYLEAKRWKNRILVMLSIPSHSRNRIHLTPVITTPKARPAWNYAHVDDDFAKGSATCPFVCAVKRVPKNHSFPLRTWVWTRTLCIWPHGFSRDTFMIIN